MKNKLSSVDAARVDEYLKVFAKENSAIRQELSSILPAYNELLEMHALSFKEFALLPIAEERGLDVSDPLFSYDNIKPACIKCGNTETIRQVEDNNYVCSVCKNKYAANHDSISSKTKCSSIVWLKVLQCLLKNLTQDQTCEFCGIAPNTYYNIRNRLFYGMQVLLSDLKLYGKIQCDNTFIHVSYKGLDLADDDYDEDSVFFNESFIPRQARVRGGSYSSKDKDKNSVCIFVAADDFGHVFSKLVGIGSATGSSINKAVGNNKFLLKVPDQDPFVLNANKNSGVHFSPGESSLLVSDKEAAIKKFAEIYGIPHECHIYREKNNQLSLSPGQNDIQRVNNYHHKLKVFLSKANYVSTKYLPGYLVLFDFIENTGATREAICELFKILAKPGLSKSPTIYKDMFITPNYMKQWLAYDNPLRKFNRNQLLAYYLYSERQKATEQNRSFDMSVNEIAEKCNMSCSSVRRNYKNLKYSGYEDLIVSYFVETEGKLKPALQIPPPILELYDIYYQKRVNHEYTQLEGLVDEMNQKYGTEYKRTNVYAYFKQIQVSGIRQALPKFKKQINPKLSDADKVVIAVYNEVQEEKARQRREGVLSPDERAIIREISKKYKISFWHGLRCIQRGYFELLERKGPFNE